MQTYYLVEVIGPRHRYRAAWADFNHSREHALDAARDWLRRLDKRDEERDQTVPVEDRYVEVTPFTLKPRKVAIRSLGEFLAGEKLTEASVKEIFDRKEK